MREGIEGVREVDERVGHGGVCIIGRRGMDAPVFLKTNSLALLLSTFRVSSMMHVYSLPIHKICALCGIFSAISALLMTEKSDDVEIRVPDRTTSLKVSS